MDKVIVTGLLIIGSVTAALVVILTIGPSVSSSSQSVLVTQREASVRIMTDIEVIAVAPNVAGTSVDVWIKNVGVAPIMGLGMSDVFMVTSNIRYDAMVYATSGDNTWTELPSGSSWNRGETLHIAVTLSTGNPLISGNHTIRFSTPNGILAERVFSR